MVKDRNGKKIKLKAKDLLEKWGVEKIEDVSIVTFIHHLVGSNELKQLKTKVNVPVIKACKINENQEYTNADYILYDSFLEGRFGGTGKVINWSSIKSYPKNIFLAGGLNINNVEEAIRTVNPYCVDINSGVEVNGKKDEQKIIEIVKKIKRL